MSEAGAPGLRRNSRANLERLLGEMIERPEQRAELAAEIDRDFGEDRAVMVLDMSGFSRTTQSLGIVFFLPMIHQMRLIALPAVTANGGRIVKAVADNLYSLFESAPAAVAAAQEIIRGLEAANLRLPEERRLYASIGIGYGRMLIIDGNDLFGNEVNLASKLGEDVADQGEILLTEAARAQVAETGIPTRDEIASISGIRFAYHALA